MDAKTHSLDAVGPTAVPCSKHQLPSAYHQSIIVDGHVCFWASLDSDDGQRDDGVISDVIDEIAAPHYLPISDARSA